MSKPRISFEFFPPKTPEGREKLVKVYNELARLGPEFFSVTYGAGGSTRDNTTSVVKEMCEAGLDVAPHLSFGGDTHDAISAILHGYKSLGVNRIVALRGDMPSGMGGSQQLVYASELVSFIREQTGNHFHLEVAAYPEVHPDAPDYFGDIQFLKEKLDAGANSAITQYFYNIDAWHWFIEQCDKAGIDKPIYPGIMPITNFKNLQRFSANCGAEIPRWLKQRMDSLGDDQQAIKDYGIEVVTRLCEQLLASGAPGLHFYTMNQVEPNRTVLENLDLA